MKHYNEPQTMYNSEQTYTSPTIEIIAVSVERGFANSNIGGVQPDGWKPGHDDWF